MKALLSASAALAAIAIAASAAAQTPQPRLNQIQVIGTHNSGGR